MAAILLPDSATITPNSIRYTWSGDGAGSGATQRTRAQILTDLQTGLATLATQGQGGPSPLLSLLTATTAALDWAALQIDSRMSVYITPRLLPAATSGSFFASLTAGLILSVVGPDAVVGLAVVELRFHLTPYR